MSSRAERQERIFSKISVVYRAIDTAGLPEATANRSCVQGQFNEVLERRVACLTVCELSSSSIAWTSSVVSVLVSLPSAASPVTLVMVSMSRSLLPLRFLTRNLFGSLAPNGSSGVVRFRPAMLSRLVVDVYDLLGRKQISADEEATARFRR